MNKIVLILFTAILSSSSGAQVIVENFRNFDCTNCKEPDERFENFLKAHPEYNASIIYYHNGTPYPLDAFYQAAKEGVDYRNKVTFYNTQGNPTVFVNGIFAGKGEQSYADWEAYTTEAAGLPKSATINLTREKNGDGTYTITMTMSGSTSQQVRPYIMILESGIIQDNTYGYKVPSSGVWDNIFRLTLPVPQGGDAFTLQGDKTLTFTFDPRGKNWNLANLSAVALLQNVTPVSGTSREIVAMKNSGTGFFESSGVEVDLIAGHGSAPNPFRESVLLSYTLTGPGFVTIRISDLLGREVATLLNERVTEKEVSVSFTPQSLVAGTYLASIYVNGSLAGTEKLIYNP